MQGIGKEQLLRLQCERTTLVPAPLGPGASLACRVRSTACKSTRDRMCTHMSINGLPNSTPHSKGARKHSEKGHEGRVRMHFCAHQTPWCRRRVVLDFRESQVLWRQALNPEGFERVADHHRCCRKTRDFRSCQRTTIPDESTLKRVSAQPCTASGTASRVSPSRIGADDGIGGAPARAWFPAGLMLDLVCPASAQVARRSCRVPRSVPQLFHSSGGSWWPFRGRKRKLGTDETDYTPNLKRSVTVLCSRKFSAHMAHGLCRSVREETGQAAGGAHSCHVRAAEPYARRRPAPT